MNSPVSELVSYLRGDRRISLVEAPGEADVIAVAAEVANASTLGLLHRLAEEGGAEPGRMNFVIVVGRCWEADVWAAVNRGLRAVLPRGSRTAAEFTQTLTAVAQGSASFPGPALAETLIRAGQAAFRTRGGCLLGAKSLVRALSREFAGTA